MQLQSLLGQLESIPRQAWWLIAILAGLSLLGGGGRRKKKKRNKESSGLVATVLVAGVVLVAAGGTGAVSKVVHHRLPGLPGNVPLLRSGAGETQWIDALLTSVGAPASQANVASIADWIRHETIGWPPACCGGLVNNNPLNTGQGEPGSYTVNSAGVKGYPSLALGLRATRDTLVNGHYDDILARLRAGTGLASGASAGLGTWSNGAYGSV